MIQFREKAERKDGRKDRRTDGTEFIRPHYRGSKNESIYQGQRQKNWIRSCDLTLPTSCTKFGDFSLGSPLSYQLSVFESNFNVTTNIKYVTNLVYDNDVYDHKTLPLGFIPSYHESIPKNWLNLTNAEMSFFDKISHTEENCHKIEENTVQQLV